MGRIKFKKSDVELEVEADNIQEAKVVFTKIVDGFAGASVQTPYKPLYTGMDEKELKRLYFVGFFAGLYVGLILEYMGKIIEYLNLCHDWYCQLIALLCFLMFALIIYFIGLKALMFIKKFLNKGNWL